MALSAPRERKKATDRVSVLARGATQAVAQKAQRKLLSYHQISAWYQDNEHILHHYRPESGSAAACFHSLGYLHNETFNIFSHLIPSIGAVILELLAFIYFTHIYPDATVRDRLVLAFFLLTAATCLGLSAAYHTMMNHSNDVCHLWLRLDFVGIVILTLGDFVSGIYLAFYCEPQQQKIYWTMILTLGTLTALILINPRFQGKRYHTIRVCTFICTGLSAFAPLVHGISLFGLTQMRKQSGIGAYLLEGALLVIGVLVYATRVPERLGPGRFDVWGSSHQIFHVFVVLATMVHLVGIARAYDYNYYHRDCRA